MARGGARAGAGRKSKSPNKLTSIRQAMIAKACFNGLSPLDVMITAMRDAWDNKKVEDATKYAAMAAPYVHPKLASTELKVDDNRTADELSTDELERIAAAGRASAFAEAEGENGSDSLH